MEELIRAATSVQTWETPKNAQISPENHFNAGKYKHNCQKEIFGGRNNMVDQQPPKDLFPKSALKRKVIFPGVSGTVQQPIYYAPAQLITTPSGLMCLPLNCLPNSRLKPLPPLSSVLERCPANTDLQDEDVISAIYNPVKKEKF